MKRLNVSLSRTLLNQFDFYLFYDVYGLDLIRVNLFTPYLDELHGQHDNNIPACFVFPLQKFQIMLKELFSMSKSNDSMVVLNQRNCCLAAKLKIVSILGSGPSPSFFSQLFFNTSVIKSYHQLIMKAL